MGSLEKVSGNDVKLRTIYGTAVRVNLNPRNRSTFMNTNINRENLIFVQTKTSQRKMRL
jgi:hypothetical protein